jgi:hypothetical protein
LKHNGKRIMINSYIIDDFDNGSLSCAVFWPVGLPLIIVVFSIVFLGFKIYDFILIYYCWMKKSIFKL